VSQWIIHAAASFDARHALVSYLGAREAVHGHEWKVAVRVGTESLNDEGYALDFQEVQSILGATVAPLEDTELNQHPEIGEPSPTAERVAYVIAEKLAPEYSKIGGRLLSVSVWEGPENRVDLILCDDN
jgi:6-pyruvoyltetrahydropterin/6-carboxytetrahydropterin synthase